jgi:hypothetical protein
MENMVSPRVSGTHPVNLVPLSVAPGVPEPQQHHQQRSHPQTPPVQPDGGLRILSSDLQPCLSLPASSQQICITPLTTTVPAHQFCLSALPTTATTSSPAHQQICLAALPATTASLAQQICLTALPTITTQSQQPQQQQQICLTALAASPLTEVVAAAPPVSSHIACIAVSDVTSLTTTAQGNSLLRSIKNFPVPE